MSDKVLFVFPTTMEEAIWAIPPMAQYLVNRIVMEKRLARTNSMDLTPPRDPISNVCVACPLHDLYTAIGACWPGIEITESVTDEQRETADLIIEFDAKRAYELTKVTQKHIVESFGFLMGAVPMSELPVMAHAIVPEERGSLLVVDRYYLDEERPWKWEFKDEFIQMGLEAGIDVKTVSERATYQELTEAITKASVVVGVRGTGTLLAASFRKTVMELSPEGYEHKNWMSKWESKTYRMIYGDLYDMTAWFVWERTNKLVAEVSRYREVKPWECHQLTTSVAASETVGASMQTAP